MVGEATIGETVGTGVSSLVPPLPSPFLPSPNVIGSRALDVPSQSLFPMPHWREGHISLHTHNDGHYP
eukprot:5760131-Prorocentrum_lima.AAC.1